VRSSTRPSRSKAAIDALDASFQEDRDANFSGEWPENPSLRYLVHWALRRDELCIRACVRTRRRWPVRPLPPRPTRCRADFLKPVCSSGAARSARGIELESTSAGRYPGWTSYTMLISGDRGGTSGSRADEHSWQIATNRTGRHCRGGQGEPVHQEVNANLNSIRNRRHEVGACRFGRYRWHDGSMVKGATAGQSARGRDQESIEFARSGP